MKTISLTFIVLSLILLFQLSVFGQSAKNTETIMTSGILTVHHFNTSKNKEEIRKKINSMNKRGIPFSILFVIDYVLADSPAEKLGIKKGNAFSLVDGKPFRSQKDLENYLKDKNEYEIILWKIENKETENKTGNKKMESSKVIITKKSYDKNKLESAIEKRYQKELLDDKERIEHNKRMLNSQTYFVPYGTATRGSAAAYGITGNTGQHNNDLLKPEIITRPPKDGIFCY